MGRESTAVAANSTAPSEPKAAAPVATDSKASTLSQEAIASYTALPFKQLYVTPAGPMGLEYSSEVKDLAGKKVSMTGHMVKLYHLDPRIFLFTEIATSHDPIEYGLADSLPVNMVHVIMDVRPGDAPSMTQRKITVYGVLETGPKQEVDGRVSHLRLKAEHVTEGDNNNLIELRKPILLQRDRMRNGQKLPTS